MVFNASFEMEWNDKNKAGKETKKSWEIKVEVSDCRGMQANLTAMEMCNGKYLVD